MKNIKLKFLALVTIIAGVTAACSLDNNNENTCYSSGYAFTTSVAGPDSTVVNKPITINFSFKLDNSCGSFIRVAETNSFPKDIYPIVEYSGCNCSTATTTLTKPYVFTAATAGNYVLRFQKDATPVYITKTIVVTAQ